MTKIFMRFIDMKHTPIELNYLQMLTVSNLPVVQAIHIVLSVAANWWHELMMSWEKMLT